MKPPMNQTIPPIMGLSPRPRSVVRPVSSQGVMARLVVYNYANVFEKFLKAGVLV